VLQHPQFTLTILDPTSLLGTQVAIALWQSFPAARRRFLHTTGADEHLIAEVGGEPSIVPPLVDAGELDGAEIVVATATPAPAVAATLVSWLRANPATFLIDCTQPGIAPAESLPILTAPQPGKSERRWLHLADPALWAPGRVLQALAPLAPDEAIATLLLPASDFGAPGVEELAKQAASRLSGRPTQRAEVLPGVLAFDAAPAAASRREALREQLRTLFPAVSVQLAAVQLGVFHGHGAVLAVHVGQPASAAEAIALIRQAPGVRLARRNERPGLIAAADVDEIVCADVQCGEGWVTAWLVADAVRVGGAQVVADVVAAVRAS
jgi:hypothetical protein